MSAAQELELVPKRICWQSRDSTLLKSHQSWHQNQVHLVGQLLTKAHSPSEKNKTKTNTAEREGEITPKTKTQLFFCSKFSIKTYLSTIKNSVFG